MAMFFVVEDDADNLLEWLLVGRKHDCQSIVMAMSEEKVSKDAKGAQAACETGIKSKMQLICDIHQALIWNVVRYHWQCIECFHKNLLSRN
jgi:hypothetical protein